MYCFLHHAWFLWPKWILLVFFKGHKSSTETFNCLNVYITENTLFFGGLENACANI